MSVRNVVKTIQDIMRKDAGVDGDAQRISQLCWMFFLKIVDDQDQEQELFDKAYRSPIPKGRRWRDWAADPEGDHRRRAARLRQRGPVSDAQETRNRRRGGTRARRGARGVRGRLQLHEVRPVDASGHQQDSGDRFQRPRRPSAFRRHLRADPQRPAERRQRRRILYAARRDRLHGRPDRPEAWRNPARPGLRHRAASSPARCATCASITSARSKTRTECRRLCAPSRRSSCRTCCASPTCCCTASRTRASSATTTRSRGPTRITAPRTGSISC